MGCAKELVESVARVTLVAAGQPSGDNADYQKVLGLAHKTIEHAVGAGLSASDPLRQVPNAAMKMAVHLRELRNRYGTGHGRAVVHNITPEVVDTCVHGALIWSRWALARMQTVLMGAVRPLVDDLLDGGTFYGGNLTERLQAANIVNLEEPDQRALGLAVGQRAARATFNVRIEGIQACSKVPNNWPPAYREAALQGLFINPDGQLYTDPDHSASSAALLLQQHPEPDTALTELRLLVADASLSLEFETSSGVTITAMEAATPQVPASAQETWKAITDDLRQRSAG
ncbi:abortive infection family protein [Streptomyces sp. UNOB3_S3]|uniref:abortive infection family protein n=1 Tax=Streptomyces sp. UNOB3_S3 TaxID=2871682 RepID=UPI001E295F3B|nr:abortive infection family protein [Streptomyces sp. UNOB3_S3]MCC3778093.1 abortive infection family protein [Streptomyces sp. UNOB3_S3]